MQIDYALDLWFTVLTIISRRKLPQWKVGDWISTHTVFHENAIKNFDVGESKTLIVDVNENRLTVECSNSKFCKNGVNEVLDFEMFKRFPSPVVSETDLGDEELSICGKQYMTHRIRYGLRDPIFIEINFCDSMPVIGFARLQKWTGSQLDVTWEVTGFGMSDGH